jgi:dihydropyrimidine dehydrogenase (NAD+) subunit PreA
MADLRTNFLGVKSPNPFWLASAPPTDRKVNVERAFRAGWGGVVWKTLGEAGPPVVNVSGARYGAIHGPDRRLIAMNNIELITDRDLEINLQEIKEVKRAWANRALIVSLMVPCDEKSWEDILARVEETECDGVELNFGCPHGMSERGMGSAVGQVPEYVEMVARWCKAHTRMPVIVKLTPNITDVRQPARAAKTGGADAVSLINTINSIMNIDLDRMTPDVVIDGKGTHGGMCGPAVKPIALSMVSEIARDSVCAGLPISAIGGITTWRDAAEFIALGAGTVQICTAAMTYGFKIVQEMITGLADYMDAKGYATIEDFRGRAIPSITDWQYLNLNYVAKAEIDQKLCIQCGRCHIVCEDTSHAICARSSVRWRTASRWCIKSRASIRAPGSIMTVRQATGRRIRTIRLFTQERRSDGRRLLAKEMGLIPPLKDPPRPNGSASRSKSDCRSPPAACRWIRACA